jgi:hypothetical protein
LENSRAQAFYCEDFARKLLQPLDYFSVFRYPDDSNIPRGEGCTGKLTGFDGSVVLVLKKYFQPKFTAAFRADQAQSPCMRNLLEFGIPISHL